MAGTGASSLASSATVTTPLAAQNEPPLRRLLVDRAGVAYDP
jgi:hypothetical protein